MPFSGPFACIRGHLRASALALSCGIAAGTGVAGGAGAKRVPRCMRSCPLPRGSDGSGPVPCEGVFPASARSGVADGPGAPVLVHEVLTALARRDAGGGLRRCVITVQGVLPADARGGLADGRGAPVLVHEVL